MCLMLPKSWRSPLVVNAGLSERRVVLKELGAQRQYEAFLSVSTRGGSLNGTTIQFNVDANTIGIVSFSKTTREEGWSCTTNLTGTFFSLHSDAVTIVMIVTASGVSLSLLIITMVMICFSKEKWWDHCQIVCFSDVHSQRYLFWLFFFLFCVSFPGLKDTSGQLFQILQTAAWRDGHQNRHRS